MAMIPIILASTKGGTGKTMTARSLADVFAEMGLTVVVQDADPQQSLTWACGAGFGADALGDDSLHSVNRDTPFEWWLRRGGTGLKHTPDARLDVLFQKLGSLEGADVLIVDVGGFEPHIAAAAIRFVGRLERGVVISPIRPNYDDIPGFAGIRVLIEAAAISVPHRGLLSDVEARYAETRAVRTRVNADYPGAFYEVEIPHCARAKAATRCGRSSPLTSVGSARSLAAQAYRRLGQLIRNDLGM